MSQGELALRPLSTAKPHCICSEGSQSNQAVACIPLTICTKNVNPQQRGGTLSSKLHAVAAAMVDRYILEQMVDLV